MFQTRQAANQSLVAAAARSLRPALVSALMLSAFANVAALTLPLYSMQIYDRVLTSRNVTTLVMVTGIAVFMLGIYAALDSLRGAILNRAGTAIEQVLGERVFDAMFQARLANPATGAIRASREVGTLREFISSGLAAFLDLPWVPLFVALSFAIHPMLGVVALLGAILIVATALATETLTRKPVVASIEHAAAAQRHSAGVLRDAETVSALGMRACMRAIFAQHQEAALAEQAAASGLASVLLSLTKLIRFSVQIAIMGVAGYLVIDRAIQPGVIFAASLLIGRALAPVEQTVASWRRFVAARQAYSSLKELLAAAPAASRPLELPRPAGRLTMEAVFVTAPGTKHPLLKNVSLAIEPGETIAVVGASGSGKSSLVRALTGVWPVATGAVRLDGAALSQWDPDQLGRHVGYVSQDVTLFAGTIAQNIARHGTVDDARVIQAATAAGVHEAILRLPKGYETSVGAAGETLSGGMRQRVALARALYGEPCLIILDEPNSNLDSAGDEALAKAIMGLKAAGKTIVVVSHKKGLLAVADKVLVMADGAAQAFGARDEILQRMGRPRIVANNGAATMHA